MSSLNSPISIPSDNDDVHLSPRSTPPHSPKFMPVSSTRIEEVEPSDETEPIEDEFSSDSEDNLSDETEPYDYEISSEYGPNEDKPSDESEPMEVDSESLGSKTKEPSPTPVEPTPAVPTPVIPTNPTPPTRVPSHRPYRPHPGGPRMLFTAKKSVPLPRKNIINPNTIESAATASRRVRARKWGWLSDKIQAWRAEEGVPSHPEVGESSNAISIPPLTQEPVHHTIPVLVARLTSHESRLHRIEFNQEFSASNEVGLLQHELEKAKEENDHLAQTISIMQDNWADIRDEATALGQRLEQSERRAHEAEQRAIQMEERMAALEKRVERVDVLGSAITQMAESVKQINQSHG